MSKDAHAIAWREVEFRPTAEERRAFVRRVIEILTRKSLVGRAEYPDGRSARVYLYARHPYGPERSTTVLLGSEDWAYSPSGAPMTPSDVAYHLIHACRSRAQP